jgi:hypothetical protein
VDTALMRPFSSYHFPKENVQKYDPDRKKSSRDDYRLAMKIGRSLIQLSGAEADQTQTTLPFDVLKWCSYPNSSLIAMPEPRSRLSQTCHKSLTTKE